MKLDIDEKEFIGWLRTKGLQTRSLWEYLRHFRRFDFNNFSQEYINQYINENSEKKYNSVVRAFINNVLLYVKRNTSYPDEVKEFVAKLYVQEVTGRKPTKNLRAITERQMVEIAKTFDIRNKLILYLSFYCGLRVSELFGDPFNKDIKPIIYEQINFTAWLKNPKEETKLTIIGKGGRKRTIPISAWLVKKIYHYGRDKGHKKEYKLFNINRRRWRVILEEASKKTIGIELHPHDLRSSCAVYLFLNGKDIVEVMNILGHDDISTTQKYLNLTDEIRKEYS